MKPLEFNPVRAAKHIALFGYHHVAKETNRSELEDFAKNNGLALQDEGEFTITLSNPNGVGRTSPQYWEEIRKQNEDKRIRAAAARKRKEA